MAAWKAVSPDSRTHASRAAWRTMQCACMLRGLRLEIFWDGATEPAVSAPLGDFFCQALGRMSEFENALFRARKPAVSTASRRCRFASGSA